MLLKTLFRRITAYLQEGSGWSAVLIVPVLLLSWIKYPASAARGGKIAFPSLRPRGLESARALRIASYNIHRAKGTDRLRNLERIAKNLNDLNLDLVALQEVAGPFVWGGENQARRLARPLGLGCWFAPTRYRAFKPDVGNALLSSTEIGNWQVQILPKTAGSMRNLMSGTVMFAGVPVLILVTHIDRGIDRSRQLHFVLEQFRQHRHAILFGDFNSRAQQSPLQEFLIENPDCDAIANSRASPSGGRIDWILTRGLVVGEGGDRPTGASDHRLYWVEVKGLVDPV